MKVFCLSLLDSGGFSRCGDAIAFFNSTILGQVDTMLYVKSVFLFEVLYHLHCR